MGPIGRGTCDPATTSTEAKTTHVVPPGSVHPGPHDTVSGNNVQAWLAAAHPQMAPPHEAAQRQQERQEDAMSHNCTTSDAEGILAAEARGKLQQETMKGQNMTDGRQEDGPGDNPTCQGHASRAQGLSAHPLNALDSAWQKAAAEESGGVAQAARLREQGILEGNGGELRGKEGQQAEVAWRETSKHGGSNSTRTEAGTSHIPEGSGRSTPALSMPKVGGDDAKGRIGFTGVQSPTFQGVSYSIVL